MNMKWITVIFFSVAVSLPGVSLQAEEAETYAIGAILPLSGSAASLGRYLKNGLDLAYAELPPEQKKRIEIHYEDDQLQSAKSVSAFQRLKSQKGIKAVFVLGSGIGNAIAPLAERAGIVCIAIGASDGGIAKGKKFAFTHWVTPEVEAEELVKELSRRKYKRIAILGTEQEGSIALLNAVKPVLEKHGLAQNVVFEQNVLPAETDFKSHVTKMKSLKAEVVITILFPGALSSFAKQARSLNFKSDLAGIELFEDEHEVKASEGALVGHWYVNADLATDKFQSLYEKKYQEAPGWGVANAFDALTLVAFAATQGEATNGSIAKYLSTLKDYSGAAGVYSGTGDNRFDLPATIKVVEKDGFSKLSS